MDNVARNPLPAKVFAGYKFVLAMTAALLLSGCGGGGGPGSDGGGSADPVAVDLPVFYVKKPVITDDSGDLQQVDLRNLLAVDVGADLYMRARTSVEASEVNLTGELTQGFGDIRDLSVSPDGERVLFSMRFPVDPDAAEDEQPFWNIWEYDVEEQTLRQVIEDPIRADEGHDIAPHYLPDGRIVFSSTRQSRSAARLIDQFRPQYSHLDDDQNEPAFVLHIMEDDGSDIVQISFNQSHDMHTTVLSDGRIVWSRWDAMLGNNAIHLYSANPDGSDMQMLYGAESHFTGTDNSLVHFIKARELPDGRLAALLTPFNGISGGGDLIAIDTSSFINNDQPNVWSAGLAGPAQESATFGTALTIPEISESGRFRSFWPLWDGTNRVLISWADCRLNLDGDEELIYPCTEENLADPSAVEADPAYGLWIYDPAENTQRAIIAPEPGIEITEVVVAEERNRPAVIPDTEFSGADPELLNQDAGILHIRSVYDIDGVDAAVPNYRTLADPASVSASQRPARFIRLWRPVPIPPDEVLTIDGTAFGASPRSAGMRELIGYAPVEPDGSVRIKVPADVPISLEILDAVGHRISDRHEHWLQVRPGEVRECAGCHINNSGVSHGRTDAFMPVNIGSEVGGQPFLNTNPAFFTMQGETMAETRTRLDPAALSMSADVVYEDVWTDEAAAGRTADAAFSLAYAEVAAAARPEMYDCVPWTVGCRVIINYVDHIQPLWEASRPEIDPDTMLPVIDPDTLEPIDRQCISCHVFRNDDNEIVDPLDRGQLELTGDPSAVEPDHLLSYRELMFSDTEETLEDPETLVQVLTFQGNFDEDGNQILEPVFLPRRLSPGNARFSSGFFENFADDGTHPGWLSPAELRQIGEWVDMGGQYYNDPFAAGP